MSDLLLMGAGRGSSGGGGGGGGGGTNTYTVAAGGDDGYARRLGVAAVGGGSSNNPGTYTSINTSSTIIQWGVGWDDDESEYAFNASFMKFDSIALAQGATIQSAYWKPFKASWSGNSVNPDKDFTVAALDVDNATAPSSASDMAHSNFTSAGVAWSMEAARVLSLGQITSPDIKTVIQEIVDRSGWSSGNSIVIVCYAALSPVHEEALSTLRSYEYSSASQAGQLEITT